MAILPPADRRTTFYGGVAIVVIALLALIAFLPIASCPNCAGQGAVSPEVNRKWTKKYPLVLFSPSFESLGRASCVRCGGRGRVSPIGALAQ